MFCSRITTEYVCESISFPLIWNLLTMEELKRMATTIYHNALLRCACVVKINSSTAISPNKGLSASLKSASNMLFWSRLEPVSKRASKTNALTMMLLARQFHASQERFTVFFSFTHDFKLCSLDCFTPRNTTLTNFIQGQVF